MFTDLNTLKLADYDCSNDLRGLIRTGRRVLQRCWRDTDTISQKRIFAQNSGACGSTYLIRLLDENDIPRSFHEKTPDLNSIGVQHFDQPIESKRLIRLLRYTRHDAYFEANNRLFSLTCEIALAFPNAWFIHLHRDGAECVRSAMSKPNVEDYLRTNVRFRGSLAGSVSDQPFTRFCHYWANMNRRIADDLRCITNPDGSAAASLRFEDLVAGKVDALESVLGQSLQNKKCQPVNVGRVRSEGKFPKYNDWSAEQKATFDSICGPVMGMLGR